MSKPSSIPIFTLSGTSIERETAGVKIAIYKADPDTGLKDTVAIAGIDIVASGNPNDYEFDVDAISHITVTALKSQLFWIVNGATEYPQWISKDGGSKGEDAVITILSGGSSYWGHNVYDDGTDIFAISNSANGAYVVVFNGADRNYIIYQKAIVAADEQINVVANSSRPVVEFTLANGDIGRGYNIKKNSADDQILSVVDGSAFAEVHDLTTDAIKAYQIDSSSVAGTRLDIVGNEVPPASDRVLKAGDTMSGPLNMGTNPITNVATPSGGSDGTNAATKDYVNTEDNKNLLIDGSRAMTGELDMGTNKIVNVVDPTAPQGVATKAYSDLKLLLTGGNISGNLDVDGDLQAGVAASNEYDFLAASATIKRVTTDGDNTDIVLLIQRFRPDQDKSPGVAFYRGVNATNAAILEMTGIGVNNTWQFLSRKLGTGVLSDIVFIVNPSGAKNELRITERNVIVGKDSTGYSGAIGANDRRLEVSNPVDNGNSEFGMNITTDAADSLIGSGLHISVSESFNIGIFSVKRSTGPLLDLTIGMVTSPNIVFNGANLRMTLTGDVVHVSRTYASVALANASGLPVGTEYRLNAGSDDVKSIKREIF